MADSVTPEIAGVGSLSVAQLLDLLPPGVEGPAGMVEAGPSLSARSGMMGGASRTGRKRWVAPPGEDMPVSQGIAGEQRGAGGPMTVHSPRGTQMRPGARAGVDPARWTAGEEVTEVLSVRSRRGWALLALSVGLNVVEALVVLLTLPAGDTVLSLQASAVAPFGVFHDLRWLSVFSSSWWSFGLEVTALIIGRGLLTAVGVGWAWPLDATLPAPRPAALAGRGVVVTAISALLLAPSTALLFGMAVVPISWIFIAAVPLALMVAIIVSPLAVVRESWRRPIPTRVVGWVVATFVVLTLGSVAVSAAPSWASVPLAAVAGAFNALAWKGLVRALVTRKPSRRMVPVIPAALVGLAAGVALGSVGGFVNARSHQLPPPTGRVVAQSGGQPVLVLHGYGSSWDGSPAHPIPGPFREELFSYRGVGPGGAPLPYTGASTDQPLGQLVGLLGVQVEDLYRTTHRKVDLVGESEGAELVETYVLEHPHAPVDDVVLLSPLVAPGRATFPVSGSGPGLAARAAIDLIGRAYQSVSPVDLSPTSGFVRSLDTRGASLANPLACPASHLHEFAFLPLADATSSTPAAHINLPYVVVPAFHGGLLGDRVVEQEIAAVLEGRGVPATTVLDAAEHLVSDASAAWQVPVDAVPAGC
jgi:hypothetical protein